MRTIYILTEGAYSDKSNEWAFSDKDQAETCQKFLSEGGGWGHDYDIEELVLLDGTPTLWIKWTLQIALGPDGTQLAGRFGLAESGESWESARSLTVGTPGIKVAVWEGPWWLQQKLADDTTPEVVTVMISGPEKAAIRKVQSEVIAQLKANVSTAGKMLIAGSDVPGGLDLDGVDAIGAGWGRDD
jgi:hypothetical protein